MALSTIVLIGTTSAVGQNLLLPGAQQPRQLNVGAVCADMPENAHFKFNVLFSTKGVPFLEEANHISFSANTYFLLHPEADPKALESKFPAIVEKYAVGEIQRNFVVNWSEYKSAGNGYR